MVPGDGGRTVAARVPRPLCSGTTYARAPGWLHQAASQCSTADAAPHPAIHKGGGCGVEGVFHSLGVQVPASDVNVHVPAHIPANKGEGIQGRGLAVITSIITSIIASDCHQHHTHTHTPSPPPNTHTQHMSTQYARPHPAADVVCTHPPAHSELQASSP